jgi:hypothetical protein
MEIKANNWYRTRGGDIAYVAAIVPFKHAFPVVGMFNNNHRTWTKDGSYHSDRKAEYDLVEHLPDCDGFDWVPTPTIQLEVGKKYVLANGEVVGPLEYRPNMLEWKWMCKRTDRWWNSSGTRFLSELTATESIVSEYVEPEPTYEPFGNAAEFAPHRDKWMRRINGTNGAFTCNSYDDHGVWHGGTRYTYKELIECKFEDGSPCGRIKS